MDAATAAWGPPVTIDGTPGFMEGLDLSVSGSDVAMLVWHGWDGQHDLFSTVRDLGTDDPWSAPSRLMDNPDGEWMVSTTFDSMNQPITVWANDNVTTVFGEGAEGIELALVPDLTIVDLELISIGTIEGEEVQLLVDVLNEGWDASVETGVEFYLGDPDAGGTQLGAPVPIVGLLPGDSQAVASAGFVLPGGTSNFFAVVTADPTEVDVTDNIEVVTVDAQPPDTTGPQVDVLELVQGDVLLVGTSVLTLRFSEPVRNVTEGDISLVESDYGMVPPDHVYLSADRMTASLIFEGGLPAPDGTASYTLRVLDRVVDMAGNPLNDGVDAEFEFAIGLLGDVNGDGRGEWPGR